MIKVIQFSNLNDKVSKLSEDINSKYCKINNYDYEFEHFNYNAKDYKEILEFANEKEDFAAIMLHKYELIEKNIKKYDYIVFIDSDACFVNPFKKIENLIDNTHDLFLSIDSGSVGPTIFILQIANIIQQILNKYKISYIPDFKLFSESVNNQISFNMLSKLGTIAANPIGLNAGFIIFKNSNIIYEFLNDIKRYYPLFVNILHDQDCISWLLQMKKYKNVYNILEKDFQGNNELKNQPEFYYNEDKNFICHNYGQSRESKIIAMNNVKNNKWWKQFKEI